MEKGRSRATKRRLPQEMAEVNVGLEHEDALLGCAAAVGAAGGAPVSSAPRGDGESGEVRPCEGFETAPDTSSVLCK